MPLLLVHPGGAEAARGHEIVIAARKSRRPVLLIDAFGTGAAQAKREETRHFLTFNRSDDANRAQDILTALAFLKRPAELHGAGKAALWSVFAAAVAPREVTLTGDLSPFGGGDEELGESFLVPGIQRAGGLEAALRLLAARGARR